MISIISCVSFVVSLFLIIFFYNFSAKLKHIYLDIKNDFASDNKYLAVITENGIWIKDEIDSFTNIISANHIEKDNLKNVLISQFDNNFKSKKYIYSENIFIKNNIWKIEKGIVLENNIRTVEENFTFKTNFNSEKINTPFQIIRTIWELYNLEKIIVVGYSINEIDLHLQKFIPSQFI